MQRDEILRILRDHRDDLSSMGVKSLALFGSAARNEFGPESDVDLLVEFQHPVGLFGFIALQQFLESILDCRVDLGTPRSLKPAIKESVLEEVIPVTWNLDRASRRYPRVDFEA